MSSTEEKIIETKYKILKKVNSIIQDFDSEGLWSQPKLIRYTREEVYYLVTLLTDFPEHIIRNRFEFDFIKGAYFNSNIEEYFIQWVGEKKVKKVVSVMEKLRDKINKETSFLRFYLMKLIEEN